MQVAVTVPGDNSVDLFTNDLGLIVITDDAGALLGYNIVAGGGMGRAHRNDDTFAQLAEPLGCGARRAAAARPPQHTAPLAGTRNPMHSRNPMPSSCALAGPISCACSECLLQQACRGGARRWGACSRCGA